LFKLKGKFFNSTVFLLSDYKLLKYTSVWKSMLKLTEVAKSVNSLLVNEQSNLKFYLSVYKRLVRIVYI